jgi:hypothetical protein
LAFWHDEEDRRGNLIFNCLKNAGIVEKVLAQEEPYFSGGKAEENT